MRTIVLRPPRYGRPSLVALCGLAGGLLAAPAGAAEYNRPWFLGMGDVRCAGGLVDVPTGAVQLRFPLPKIPGRIGHALAWYYTGQDGSGGPWAWGPTCPAG